MYVCTYFSALCEITWVQNHIECVVIGTAFHVDIQITEAVTLCLVKVQCSSHNCMFHPDRRWIVPFTGSHGSPQFSLIPAAPWQLLKASFGCNIGADV